MASRQEQTVHKIHGAVTREVRPVSVAPRRENLRFPVLKFLPEWKIKTCVTLKDPEPLEFSRHFDCEKAGSRYCGIVGAHMLRNPQSGKHLERSCVRGWFWTGVGVTKKSLLRGAGLLGVPAVEISDLISPIWHEKFHGS